jgi:hypothetical protein
VNARLVDFIPSGKPRDERVEPERWKSLTYESFDDADNLPAPEVIAREIVEDLTAALAEFDAVAAELEGAANGDAASTSPAPMPCTSRAVLAHEMHESSVLWVRAAAVRQPAARPVDKRLTDRRIWIHVWFRDMGIACRKTSE